MPQPPGELPRAPECGGRRRLGEQCPRGEHADEHRGRPSPVEQPVADDGDGEERDGDTRDHAEVAPRLVLQHGLVEGWELPEREEHPHEEDRAEHGHDHQLVPERPRAGRPREVERRQQCEHRRDQKADGRRGGPAEVGDVDQHHRRRQHVHREEPHAGDERARHEEDARIVVGVRGVGDQDADPPGDERGGEDQAEVGVVVLPPDVGARLGEQQPETEDGQGEVHDPDRGPQRRRPPEGDPGPGRGALGRDEVVVDGGGGTWCRHAVATLATCGRGGPGSGRSGPGGVEVLAPNGCSAKLHGCSSP